MQSRPLQTTRCHFAVRLALQTLALIRNVTIKLTVPTYTAIFLSRRPTPVAVGEY